MGKKYEKLKKRKNGLRAIAIWMLKKIDTFALLSAFIVLCQQKKNLYKSRFSISPKNNFQSSKKTFLFFTIFSFQS
jgi:hypothetical protein